LQIIPRKAIKITNADLKIRGYKLHTNEKTYIGKIAKGFDFCGFRLFYNKILLSKSYLDKFEKSLNMFYEQLLINNTINNKEKIDYIDKHEILTTFKNKNQTKTKLVFKNLPPTYIFSSKITNYSL
jgi:hypothetical protein